MVCVVGGREAALVGTIVVDCVRGEITCLMRQRPGEPLVFGRLWVNRRISGDEAIYLRSRLVGQPWDELRSLVASSLSMPVGTYIRCKFPA